MSQLKKKTFATWKLQNVFFPWFSFKVLRALKILCTAARITRSEPKPENPLEKWRRFVGKEQLWRICVSRHQTVWEHYRKEKPVKKHNIPPLSLTSDVAPALDSSEKEKTHKDIRVGCSHSRLCAALQLGNTRAGKFPSTSFSWEATQCPQPHLAVVLLPLLNPCRDKSQL